MLTSLFLLNRFGLAPATDEGAPAHGNCQKIRSHLHLINVNHSARSANHTTKPPKREQQQHKEEPELQKGINGADKDLSLFRVW